MAQSATCPACGSERGFYEDVDNGWKRCLACFSPVPGAPETSVTTRAGRPAGMEGSGRAKPDEAEEVQPKVVKAQDKAVRGPKEKKRK